MSNKKSKSPKRLRFAIYTRYSSDLQNEMSLEDQEATCRAAVAERGGVIVNVYSDSARSGWSLDRDGFNQMRAAAERNKFDAVMVWKFDRLARNHEHSVMIKMLLRHEYNLKLYCVEGVSEDDDDSPYSAFMEQMLAVFSAFYSKNLSTETKRAKRQRAMRGEFNGSIAPIGYWLQTKANATDDCPAGLYIVPRVAVIVRRAFRMYATGDYSARDIAEWMNSFKVIQELRKGKQPLNKETVRDMLQNRVYTGRVSHTDTQYTGSLGEGRKSSRGRKEWFEGKHEGFVSDAIFDLCQLARAELAASHKTNQQQRTYILHDCVYCAQCIADKPSGLTDDRYGKMRPYWQNQNERGYYRCRSRDRGYAECGQAQMPVDDLDEQVVAILANLDIPRDFRERIEHEVQGRVDNAAAMTRMEEINEIIERIDFRWDQGFISKEEYIEKRERLARELDALRPIDYDDLIEAADLIENFRDYWCGCLEVDNPTEARQQLLHKIVDRVFVHQGQVMGVVLHGDFGVVLGQTQKASAEIANALGEILTTSGVSLSRSQFGSDGHGALTGCVILSDADMLRIYIARIMDKVA